jgi:hypothetical protein
MAEPHPFSNVKLICGIIASERQVFGAAQRKLEQIYGHIDLQSPFFPFDFTDYYEKQMGKNLRRQFLSFTKLIEPDRLAQIKLFTNQLEQEIKREFAAARRIVNLDPGYLTSAALVIATAKDFAHRVPLQEGIYAHLEFLFGREEVKILDWTYPDFKSEEYQDFFLRVRRIYLSQLKRKT